MSDNKRQNEQDGLQPHQEAVNPVPLTQKPETPYEAIGREERIRALVDRFYDIMDSAPEASGLRALHPAELTESRNKLYWFLVGWMGGPPEYTSRFGHPRLRARHLPFPIAEAERDQWLWCMFRAMEETGVPEAVRQHLRHAFAGLADFMRNREG
jgi:hemoglobin